MKKAQLALVADRHEEPVRFNIQPRKRVASETNVVELCDQAAYQGHFIEDEEWVFPELDD